MSPDLTPGFTDPVLDAQRCFRAVLNAMAQPGRIHTVTGVVPPSPLCAATAAVLLTLTDHETPLWLAPDAVAASAWIGFHCGAPIITAPNQAAFAVSLGMPDLGLFLTGTHEAPETSATVIVQLPALTGGLALRLCGPGLKSSALLAPTGVTADFITAWDRNRRLFPGGIDLILCAGDELAALPRTVTITEA